MLRQLCVILASVIALSALSACVVAPPPPPRGAQDQDRDGIANRRDGDRDGDGTPNPWDRRPNDPYRR